jgi:putative ABC transport system substrate-binding protein
MFQYDRLPTLAADLVSRKVDLIVTTNTPTALAAKSATSTIPIVFTYVSDPVGMGLVADLARPGGNLTGFSNIAAELIPKGIELICELVPQAGVIALLVNQNSANAANVIRHAQEAARAKGVQLAVLNAGTEREVDAAFASLVQLQAGALVERFSAYYGLWGGHLTRGEPAPMREMAELFLSEAVAQPGCPETSDLRRR